MELRLDILGRQFTRYQEEYEAAALRVLRSGWYVLGPEVEAFEQEFAAYTGRRYCVGVNSGLDALTLSVRALGIGAGYGPPVLLGAAAPSPDDRRLRAVSWGAL